MRAAPAHASPPADSAQVFDFNGDGGLSLAEVTALIETVARLPLGASAVKAPADAVLVAEKLHQTVHLDANGNIALTDFISIGSTREGVLYELLIAPLAAA